MLKGLKHARLRARRADQVPREVVSPGVRRPKGTAHEWTSYEAQSLGAQ
jgi:hypothetical protein